ncbi:helix-turn-helix domain-containing protein [Flavobacterium sp. IB48]|uniref:helix-turn-helix domain-containing protein n=1 Tax=Flavobacterium sp. IB48 TaxID=2779375 RepID=UPI0018E8A5F0|nr:helix-turn-helix domain-containing protein [Flavobacterium sp. IB48]MBJ2125985.1 helix-turn-helix domain-containing protein [Flavobacterium sp. IB48]
MRITRICQFCNQEFTAKTTKTKYCSLKCSSRNYKLITRHNIVDVRNKETERIRTIDFEVVKKRQYLSINNCVQFFGISRRTLYRMIERKDLETVKLGRRRLVSTKSIEALFAVNEAAEAKPAAEPQILDLNECCTISRTGLYFLIKKHNIRKHTSGKFPFGWNYQE